ncbi:hypothetical protein [Maledivibacter halophilus]|uniref:Lipoprotein n=1 Tax=Maledivibacter halophilus TaxID=36842 RepID=A0A1T5L0H7_9FIRM|nr:hypothetical protein [Maledivibacter halophilus]SKC69413.1 hypothetical protein SAMN02194393_02255 [Maledivibacter halophilus]
MKKLIAVGKVLLIVALIFTLAACSNENKVSATEEIDVDKSMDKGAIEQQNENKQNTKLDTKEKEELINKFTETLKNTQNRKVMFGEFLDDNHYVYVSTDQLDQQNEKILIVNLNDGNAVIQYEGGDVNDKPILQIHKLFINRLNDCENPNVCVFRKNEEYTKVEIFEITNNGKEIHHVDSCRRDNKTGEYTGNENYKYVLDFSFSSDYCNE